MKPRLSICIPVYNCVDFLGQALDSILGQDGASVEVVVLDGGSTDATEQLMAGYLSRFANVLYFRNPARGGIDADLDACVGHASGDYCWLFSGDDVMRPGALKACLEAISTGLDVYVCQHSLCNIDMRVLRNYPVLNPDISFTADLADPGDRKTWFGRAVSSEAFFSFMSGLVIKRETWNSGRLIPEFTGSCWAHIARLFELIPGGLRVHYVSCIWLDQRGGNDSFRQNGLVNRYRLAIEGFHRLGHAFFPTEGLEAFHLRRVIRYEFTLPMFLMAKLLCVQKPAVEHRSTLDRLVAMTYGENAPAQLLAKLVYRATPIFVLRAVRNLWDLAHRK